MAREEFIKNYVQVVTAIRMCIEKNLLSPALILIYSTFDSYAWMVVQEDVASVRQRFERFVNEWVLPNHPLPLTAVDIFAARCAILHRLTPDSDLSKKGAARRVLYAWGSGETSKLAAAAARVAPDCVAVHIEDLANALFDSMLAVEAASASDDAMRRRLETAARQHYSGLETRTVEEFLKTTSSA